MGGEKWINMMIYNSIPRDRIPKKITLHKTLGILAHLLRMVPWNLIKYLALRFVSVTVHPNDPLTFGEVIGSLGKQKTKQHPKDPFGMS